MIRPSLIPFESKNIVATFVFLLIVAACSTSNGDELSVSDPVTDSTMTASNVTSPDTSQALAVTTTTTTTPTTTTQAPTIDECLASIPLRVRLGQLLFPVITQGELADATELVSSGQIAGVVLIGAANASLRPDLEALQAASLIGPSIIAVDEEGGRVQRVADQAGIIPSARVLAADNSPAEARSIHRTHAQALGELGFTMNLAPVLDLDTGSYIRDRSFSADPQVVIEYGLAVADGIIEGGLDAVVKHFPGHGRGTDSHTGLPTVPALALLQQSDLLPFEAAIAHGDVSIMIGHLVVPDLTEGLPASISPAAITGLLREQMGFDGLIMTDALNMDAIAVDLDGATAAVRSIVAGADLAMVGRLTDVPATVDQLEAAITGETLTERSVNESFLRVMDTKGINACDIPAEEAPAIRCEGITTGGCSLVSG